MSIFTLLKSRYNSIFKKSSKHNKHNKNNTINKPNLSNYFPFSTINDTKQVYIYNNIKLYDKYYYLNKYNRENHTLSNTIENNLTNYIKAENKYTNNYIKSLPEYKYYKSRLTELYNDNIEDFNTPYEYDNNYKYYYKHSTNNLFPELYRIDINNNTMLVFSPNKLAKYLNAPYMSINSESLSPNGQYYAVTYDSDGKENYKIAIYNIHLQSFINLSEINNVNNAFTISWMNDNIFLYTTVDEQLRSNQVWKYKFNEKPINIFTENRDNLYTDVIRSKDGKYSFINLNSRNSSEVYFMANDSDSSIPILVTPLEEDLQYFVEHFNNDFYIITNANASNYQVMKTSAISTSRSNWSKFVPELQTSCIAQMDCIECGLVVYYSNAVVYYDWSGIPFPINLGRFTSIQGGINPWNTSKIRLISSSLLFASTTYDFCLQTKDLIELSKSGSLIGNNFIIQNLNVTAEDGALIPLTLVHKKDMTLDSSNKILLHVYGAYGQNILLNYDWSRFALLEDNWLFAFAHVRGGMELGRSWYENGRLANKQNSFNDFTACAKFLIDNKYSNSKLMAAFTRSAGGLVIGHHINNFGNEYFKSIVTKVPFVDLIGNLSNRNLPLSSTEFDEWGNPNDIRQLEYMKSYDPLQNIKPNSYPNIYATGSINDTRVPFSDPLKWICAIRDSEISNDKITLVDISDIGHTDDISSTGIIEDNAKIFAFLSHTIKDL